MFIVKKIEIVVLLFTLTFSIIACQSNTSNKQKELELKERELEIREKELLEREKSSSSNESRQTEIANTTFALPQERTFSPSPTIYVSKFVYVTFIVQEPKLHHIDAQYLPGLGGISTSTRIPEVNTVTFVDYVYTSEIKEIPGYDENKQYEYMDKMEANVRQQILYANMNFDSEVFMNVSDRAEQQRLKDYKATIIDRKLNVFDTYKEASIHRNNNKGKL